MRVCVLNACYEAATSEFRDHDPPGNPSRYLGEQRVETPAALAARIDEAALAFGGALVEEFLEGRDFTVLVAEHPDNSPAPRAFAPIELRFSPGETFKHFDLKWIDYGRMSSVPVVGCPRCQ